MLTEFLGVQQTFSYQSVPSKPLFVFSTFEQVYKSLLTGDDLSYLTQKIRTVSITCFTSDFAHPPLSLKKKKLTGL